MTAISQRYVDRLRAHHASLDRRSNLALQTRHDASMRRIEALRGPWHETRRRAVLDTVRMRHVRDGATRATLITRLFGD